MYEKIKLTYQEFLKIEKEFEECREKKKSHPKYNDYTLVREWYWYPGPEEPGYMHSFYLER